MKQIVTISISIFISLIYQSSDAQLATFQKTIGGANDDWGTAIQQTSDGGYIIAGNTTSFGTTSSDIYLIKTDANGDTLWTKTFHDSLVYLGLSSVR